MERLKKEVNKFIYCVAILIVLISLFSLSIKAKGYLAITMEDGRCSQYYDALPIFERYNITGGIAPFAGPQTGCSGSSGSFGRNYTILKEFYDKGWEIMCQGWEPGVILGSPTLTEEELINATKGCKEFYNNWGFPVYTYAYEESDPDMDKVWHMVNRYFVWSYKGGSEYIPIELLTYDNILFNGMGMRDLDTFTKRWIERAINKSALIILLFHSSTNGINDYGGNLSEILAYVRQKIDSGELEVLPPYELYWKLKNLNINDEIKINTDASTNNYSIDLTQDPIENITIRVYGLNLTNYIVNPSFENWNGTNLTNWTLLSGVYKIEKSNDSLYGNYSAVIYFNSTSGWTRGVYQEINISNTSIPGNFISVSVNGKNIENTSYIYISLDFYDSTGKGVGISKTKGTGVTTNWTKIADWYIKVPNNTAKIKVQIRAIKATSKLGAFAIDGVVLTKTKNYITQFFEGSKCTENVSMLIDGQWVNATGSYCNGTIATLQLPGNYSWLTINSTVEGCHAVGINITGKRAMAIKYGRAEAITGGFNITEYWQNKTEIYMWDNISLQAIPYITYIIKQGKKVKIGNVTIKPTYDVNIIFKNTNNTINFTAYSNNSYNKVYFTFEGLTPNQYYTFYKNGTAFLKAKTNSSGSVMFFNHHWSSYDFSSDDTNVSDATLTVSAPSEIYVGSAASFKAYYKDANDSATILNAECNLTIDGATYSMSFDEDNLYYEKTLTFNTAGTYAWIVSCKAEDYPLKQKTGTLIVKTTTTRHGGGCKLDLDLDVPSSLKVKVKNNTVELNFSVILRNNGTCRIMPTTIMIVDNITNASINITNTTGWIEKNQTYVFDVDVKINKTKSFKLYVFVKNKQLKKNATINVIVEKVAYIESECVEHSIRCVNNTLEECINGKWVVKQQCWKCVDGKCITKPGNAIRTAIIAVVVIAIIIAIVVAILKLLEQYPRVRLKASYVRNRLSEIRFI